MKTWIACALIVLIPASLLIGWLVGQFRKPPMVPVVVVAIDLPAGTMLNRPEEMLTIQTCYAASAPPGAIHDVEDLRNKIIGRNLAKGEPCTTKDLSQGGLIVGPRSRLRAVTIRVQCADIERIDLLPGDRVDVILNWTDPESGEELSETLLQSIQVLGRDALRVNDRRRNLPVTLAVRATDVAKILLATERGEIQLLRKPW